MAANQLPIYSKIGDIQWINSVLAANITTDLTTGTIYLAFTADATNGGFVTKVRFRSLGTNVATVARIWLNNGAVTTVAANNTLWDELTLPATTVIQTANLVNQELPLGFALPAGYKIYVTLGTVVAAGYDVAVIGGKY
jgi:hypothetical protein